MKSSDAADTSGQTPAMPFAPVSSDFLDPFAQQGPLSAAEAEAG
jgi:hypothetical protein